MATNKSIGDYTLNNTLDDADLYLVQKSGAYVKRTHAGFKASSAEAQTGTDDKKFIVSSVLASWWTWAKTQAATFSAIVTFTKRVLQAKGIDVTAANDLTLGSDGNTFTITGNTQINAITTSGWTAGSRIILIFSGTPTVKNNTAGGAGTAVLLLNGSADLVAAANTVLDLAFDGTQWQEVSRKVA